MNITIDGAEFAGQLTQEVSWTDDELKQIIVFERLALAFLRGKGEEWSLAIKPLRFELEQFENFARERHLPQRYYGG